MVRFFCWVMVVLLLAASGGNSAPIKGAYAHGKLRVGARSHIEFEEIFEGGRRACVIAVGDHNPPVEIAIAVNDEAGRLVAEDRGVDYVAAIWYPAREAKYKVVVSNSGVEYNIMYIVFK
jgi:hypothetical protein